MRRRVAGLRIAILLCAAFSADATAAREAHRSPCTDAAVSSVRRCVSRFQDLAEAATRDNRPLEAIETYDGAMTLLEACDISDEGGTADDLGRLVATLFETKQHSVIRQVLHRADLDHALFFMLAQVSRMVGMSADAFSDLADRGSAEAVRVLLPRFDAATSGEGKPGEGK